MNPIRLVSGLADLVNEKTVDTDEASTSVLPARGIVRATPRAPQIRDEISPIRAQVGSSSNGTGAIFDRVGSGDSRLNSGRTRRHSDSGALN